MTSYITAKVYKREASVDPTHGYTVKFKEMWIPSPYNLCVNTASDSVLIDNSVVNLNIQRSNSPILECRIDFHGPMSVATDIHECVIDKRFADKCLELCELQESVLIRKQELYMESNVIDFLK